MQNKIKLKKVLNQLPTVVVFIYKQKINTTAVYFKSSPCKEVFKEKETVSRFDLAKSSG
jgi:hypothetical protein